MPVLNYSTGSACMGFGAIAIDGAVPANLSGTLANYPKWLSATEVLYHQYGNGETLEKYNVNSGVVTQVDASGANFLGAGNSVWAAWLAGSGLRTSVGGLGPFPNAGLIEVSETGILALVTNRASDSGIKTYSSTGTLLQTIAVQLTNTISISCRENMLAYQDASGWHLVNATTGAAITGFASRANVLICIPFTFNSQVWVMELDTSTSQLSLRNVQNGSGWVVGNSTGQEYWYDVRPRGMGCRIAWSTGQGELASELVLTDVNLSTGTNQVGTVSGGSVVFAAGTAFTGQSFPSINSSAFRPPLVQQPIDPVTNRFTKPWAAFFRTVGETARTQGTAITAIQGGSLTQPHDPLTDLLNADNLVEGTVPHARKWTETVVTDTGTENNYAIGLADQLTCNNASSLTFTGFNAGIGGRRLVVSPANSTLILANESASSTAANRIVTGTGADLTLTTPVILAYDTDDDRWKVVGAAGTGDVSGPASSTDNAIARFDGTGGKTLQNSAVTVDNNGVVAFPDNQRQTFNPGTDAAGLNVGAVASDPGTLVNGDLFYNSGSNELKARINGTTVALGAASGGGGSVSAIDVERLARAQQGLAVYSGCEVTEDSGGASMDVDVSAGHIRLTTGVGVLVTAGSVTLDTADGSNDRIDLVWVDSSGTLGETAGTPAATPEPPDIPAGCVLLAMISVPASDTTISTAQITDKRTYTKLPILVVKPSDESVTSSTTLQDDDDLKFTVGANNVWTFDLELLASSGASNTPDIKHAFTIPSGATITYTFVEFLASATAITQLLMQGIYQNSSPLEQPGGVLANTAVQVAPLRFRGCVRVGSTPGTVQVQWAQNTSDGTATVVKADSFIRAELVS